MTMAPPAPPENGTTWGTTTWLAELVTGPTRDPTIDALFVESAARGKCLAHADQEDFHNLGCLGNGRITGVADEGHGPAARLGRRAGV